MVCLIRLPLFCFGFSHLHAIHFEPMTPVAMNILYHACTFCHELMCKISFFVLIFQVLPRLKSFAPWHYFLKVFVLLAVSFGLEFYIHSTGSYVWYLMMPLGFLFALIGKLPKSIVGWGNNYCRIYKQTKHTLY